MITEEELQDLERRQRGPWLDQTITTLIAEVRRLRAEVEFLRMESYRAPRSDILRFVRAERERCEKALIKELCGDDTCEDWLCDARRGVRAIRALPEEG